MVGVFRSEVRQAREALAGPRRPWERGGSVDVEQLAAWAYGAQMVDRFERVGLHPIEAAASGFEPSAYSGDGVGQLMAIENLGCRIDRTSVSVADVCHPAAYAVARELSEVANSARVRLHALAGTRPREWVPPEHFARAAVWKSSKGSRLRWSTRGPAARVATVRSSCFGIASARHGAARSTRSGGAPLPTCPGVCRRARSGSPSPARPRRRSRGPCRRPHPRPGPPGLPRM
jgi:hypothetical protein